jgi:hypothetical protein
MSKSKERGYFRMLNENRVKYKVLSDDVVVFRRHDRMYRLSNLANNWLPGKLFVLINANTTNQAFEAADRINLLSSRSRTRCAKFLAELWQLEDSKVVREDLGVILEILSELGLTEVEHDPAKAPRQFGKPWSNKTAKLAQV